MSLLAVPLHTYGENLSEAESTVWCSGIRTGVRFSLVDVVHAPGQVLLLALVRRTLVVGYVGDFGKLRLDRVADTTWGGKGETMKM